MTLGEFLKSTFIIPYQDSGKKNQSEASAIHIFTKIIITTQKPVYTISTLGTTTHQLAGFYQEIQMGQVMRNTSTKSSTQPSL